MTNKEVFFLSVLPKKHRQVIQSGSISISRRKNGHYNRYWFVLKNGTFSYFNSFTDQYFPVGFIDLQYAIKADAEVHSDGTLEPSTFRVVTEKHTYHFKTDSDTNAHEWVRALQKEIFRIRNEGDEVKIRIPLNNILDLENIKVLSIIDALRLRVVDSSETYNISEYVLAFLHGIKSDEHPDQDIRDAMKDLGITELSTEDPEKIASHRQVLTISDSTYSGPSSPVNMSPPGTPRRSDSLPRGSSAQRSSSPGALSSIGRKVSRRLTNLVAPSRVTSHTRESNEHEDKHKVSSDDSDESPERLLKIPSFSLPNKVTEIMNTNTVKHFGRTRFPSGDKYLASEEEQKESTKHFLQHFSFESEELVASYHVYLQKGLLIYGKIYVSENYVCFKSIFPNTKTIMIVPNREIQDVLPESGCRFGHSGLVIVGQYQSEIFFDFNGERYRNDALDVIKKARAISKKRNPSIVPEVNEHVKQLRYARMLTYQDSVSDLSAKELHHTGIVETTFEAMTPERPARPLKFTLLTIGSRGDVQPYIALAKGLMKEGHSVRIASHAEFRPWVEKHGIEYAEIAGDPGELMKLMINHGMFSYAFLKDAITNFRGWIDELLATSWEACQGSDVIIEAPSAMGGIHIAEALGIPYFRAMTMPWTRTRAYPHAFLTPDIKKGGSYNYMTYVLFDNLFWKGISSQVNKWRKVSLGLEKTNLDRMSQTKIPFMYNVSPSVLVPPVDFSDWIHVTGYWFLDEGNEEFEPPKELVEFIEKARADNKKIVYIGFGSIVVPKPAELTKAVIKSVQAAGVRCVLSKGWSDRYGAKDNTVPEVELPFDIYQIKAAPHDWLFPKLDAAVHHGGSGTTGASLRAGLPTIIKPFFGDQVFYGSRVEDLGVGICLKKLNVSNFSKALIEVTTNEKMIAKAAEIGKDIRKEDGISSAITTIYKEMAYAKSLIKKEDLQSVESFESEEKHDSFLLRELEALKT